MFVPLQILISIGVVAYLVVTAMVGRIYVNKLGGTHFEAPFVGLFWVITVPSLAAMAGLVFATTRENVFASTKS